MKILLIEDNPGDARLVREMLKEFSNDFSLDDTERLAAGLQFLASNDVDVVLLDLNLPDSNGLETLTRVSTEFPLTPIIVMTSVDDEALAVQAVRQGAEDYLVKGQIESTLLRRALVYAIERKRLQYALERSEQRYRLIVETANEGIWLNDVGGKVTFANQRAADIFGYSLDDVMGRSSFDFIAEDLYPVISAKLKNRRIGFSEQYDLKMRRKDGTEIWILVSATPIFDAKGKYLGSLGVFSDISERKQAEERIRDALRESWQKQLEIEALLKGSRAILEYSKFDDAARSIYNFCKNLVGATGGYIALLNRDGTENEVSFLDSGGLSCTVDPSLPMPIRGLRGEVYRTGKVIYHNDFADSEWLNFLPSGHVPVENVLFAPLMIEGKAVGLLGLANKPGGFTENDARLASGFGELASISLLNSRIWESLQQSEAKYRILVEASPDGVLSIDAEGHVVDCNEGLCQLLGYDKARVKGNDIRKFIPDIKPAELTAQLINQEWFESEFEAVRQNGQTVTLWAKGVAIVDEDGKLIQALLYIRDIAERKKLDELKDELIGLVSHEIRTPLTVIMGGLNTLLSEGARLSGEEKQQLLQDAALETNSLAYLLGDLIELSRAQANRLALNLEPVAIKSITKSVVGKLEQQTTAHRFVIGLPPRLPKVQADPVRIERILHNLLENAVKYSPQGGEIRVFAKRDKNNLVIGVSDQGIGISQSDQIRLFKPFERLENRDIEEIKGAGLGLMVCRRLVEAHGGRIWVESQKGLGSTFFFSLPLKKTVK